MNLPGVVDVAIGLVVLYFLLSTVCSYVVELIATSLWWRKLLLYETIGRLITGQDSVPAPAVPNLMKFFARKSATGGQSPPPMSEPEFFSVGDIEDLPSFLLELSKSSNPISVDLVKRFDQTFRDALSNGTNAGQPVSAQSLVNEINQVIKIECLYDQELYAAVALSSETSALIANFTNKFPSETGVPVVRLNRLLLEDAYPKQLTPRFRLASEVLAEFWDHPLAKNLAPSRQLPSYVEPTTFATIVIDVAVPGTTDATLPSTAEGIERVIQLGAASGEAHLKPLRAQILTIYRLRGVKRAVGQPEPPPLAELQSCIADWYNEAMDRLGGQYKRKVQKALFMVGLAVALLLNADTIRAAYVLGTNDALRSATATFGATLTVPAAPTNALASPSTASRIPPVASTSPVGAVTSTAVTTSSVPGTSSVSNASTKPAPASNSNAASSSNSATEITSNLSNLRSSNELAIVELRTGLANSMKDLQQLQQLGFPLGWTSAASGTEWSRMNFAPYDGSNFAAVVLFKLTGLLATAIAISLGAPFWFDLLNKLVSLRSSGNRISTADPVVPAPKTAAAGQSPATASVASASSAPTVGTSLPSGDLVKDLAEPSLGFNRRKACWSAEAALLAYAARESVRSTMQLWSMDEALFFDNVEAAQAFLAVDKNKKFALLAFRGTEKKLDDWKTDAEFKSIPSPTGSGKTHEGFTTQLDRVYPEIVAALKKQLGNGSLLYVTGHSLGGGLATLMAARLATDGVCGVHAVHTFGSPRVGDREFAKAYELALGHCSFRVVNAEDLVTRVPPRVVPGTDWRYDHVGQVVYFDSDGRMQLNAGFWERFLNTVINAVQDFRKAIQTSLKDHSMELYVRLLRKTAAEDR